MSYPPPRITSMEFTARARSETLTEKLDEAVGMMWAISADALEAIPHHDERRLWRRDGATSMASWLAARYGLAWGTAREWVRVANALRHLPRIARAYRGGRLSWDQLRPLSRFAQPETDALWAEKAPALRPAALWREARRHEEARKRASREARRMRYLALQRDEGLPIVWLEGALPAEEGAALEAALARRAEEIVVEDGVADPQGARMADALVELATAAEGDHPAPPVLVVHAQAEVLAGAEPESGPLLSETEQGDPLETDAVRRLACDARVEWVLESEGRPVGIGRRGRTVPAQIARLLRHRDRTCRFPGCERKRWLRAHHLVHWSDGGATDLDNLVLLCHAHHALIHEGGWRTSGHPGRHLRFHDPGGRIVPAVLSRVPPRADHPGTDTQ